MTSISQVNNVHRKKKSNEFALEQQRNEKQLLLGWLFNRCRRLNKALPQFYFHTKIASLNSFKKIDSSVDENLSRIFQNQQHIYALISHGFSSVYCVFVMKS